MFRLLKLKFGWLLIIPAALMLAAAVAGVAGNGNKTVSIDVVIPELGAARIQTLPGKTSLINLGESPQGGRPGDPKLPYKLISVLVPPDADLETVQSQLISGDWEELPGEYEIAPAPPAGTWDGEKFVIDWSNKDSALIIDGKDTTIYGEDAYFPAESVEVVSVGLFRQWKLVEMKVWLAAYNPVKKKVRVLRNVSTRLSVQPLPAAKATGLSSPTPPLLPNTKKFMPELRKKIVNPQDIETFYEPAEEGAAGGGEAPGLIPADYVIITTSTIVSTSTQLAAFITAKQTAGYTVKTVTEGAAAGDTTYVTGATCDQRADNIRSWLQANWASDGIQYVLLIGNPHPTTFSATTSIPMKWVWPRSTMTGGIDYRKCPTDMYFAELSFTWDLDSDGQYGEFVGDYGAGGADKNCEVKLGRIPFYTSYTDLDSILLRAITYGSTTTNIGWRSKVLIPAAVSNFGPQDNNGDGDASDPGDFSSSSDRTFGDDWGQDIKTLASSVGVSSYTLYEKTGVYAGGSAYPLTTCDASLTNANFINEWQNYYGFVTWWAHGSQTSSSRFTWTSDSTFVNITGNQSPHLETSWPTLISYTDCPSLDANYPSFVVQASCNNGYPENINNLGYSLLKNGAIATVSGTRITWYAIGSWQTTHGGNYGDNASYGYHCFDEMAVSSETVGQALVNCKSSFGTGWASGSSWMNMVGFNLYGDPSLSLGLGDKWEQKPDMTENGIDIKCDRNDGFARILADDFLCTTTGPITDVVLWGSWLNDYKGVIKNIHLSIHDDNPSGPMGWSEPNTLLWSRDFSFPADINETLYITNIDPEWWWDPVTGLLFFPGDYQIWQYEITIDDTNQFVQQGDPCNPIVYWLDVYVELDPEVPDCEFGWKTRDIADGHFNDDAVWSSDDGATWNELRYPMGHNYYSLPPDQNSIDMSFIIITAEGPNEPNFTKPLQAHTKWSQPPIEVDPTSAIPTYCGWDELSHNKVEPGTQQMKIVADDYRCIGSMPVTSIHWWGSFFDWEWSSHHGQLPPVLPENWWIGFWSNVPAGPMPYSYPEILLHSITIPANRVTFEEVGSDEYYGYYPYDICYQYNVDLEPEEVFWQDDFNEMTTDNIYWISIVAEYNDLAEPYYKWGWKTRGWHWMDDAVTFNLQFKPADGFMTDPALIVPLKDPVWQESFDVAFELNTDPNYIKWEQLYTGIRHWPHYEDVNSMSNIDFPDQETFVADDWQCIKRTPVTAIVWWGSYIGYGYEACTQGPFMPLPVKPNRFNLAIWTDVPVGADPNYPDFSHPGKVIWSYDTEEYDEVLVGYDKHPHGDPNEPVFRYSVRLPEDMYFKQPDFNGIFWLSVQAVYDINIPNYQWGWTNHEHMFNDNAVSANIDPTSGQIIWTELYDQTDANEDMSFILFTDPTLCSDCPNYNLDSIVNFLDYAEFANEWVWSGSPGGYNNGDLDCNGTVDLEDLRIFCLWWLGVCP